MDVTKEFVATVFVVQNNKVLMTWNRKVSTWVPIGGHVDANELPCDCVVREAKEESGLDIELVDIYNEKKEGYLVTPISIHLDNVKEDHKHINLTYLGNVLGGECKKIDDEGKELRWFLKEELESTRLLPNVKEMALMALDKLVASKE